MSLVAFISSDPELQRFLPQILIGNDHKLTKRCMRELSDMSSPNLIIWSAKSGWVNHELMGSILKTLHERLSPHVRGRQTVLVMDVARSHISPALSRQHMWIMFVPRRLTGCYSRSTSAF